MIVEPARLHQYLIDTRIYTRRELRFMEKQARHQLLLRRSAKLTSPRNQLLKKMVKALRKTANRYGFELNREELSMAAIPNGIGCVTAFAWFCIYIKANGDEEPNRDEIHLDPVDEKDVYEEYMDDMSYDNKTLDTLSYSMFTQLWRSCFKFVKIRVYKSCSGKCHACATFSDLRSRFKDSNRREMVTALFALHRTMFMGERIQYANRIMESRRSPDSVLSLVADGMQQTHCELPYMRNLSNNFKKLKQHLQGITTHGKRTRIYRTFENLKGGANLALHTLLMSLEEEYKSKGRLPRKIYIQVDGGSENTNWTFQCMMEILIAMDIGAEEVWVVRMPKGHNHADQDGKFALIWCKVRNMCLTSPGEYEEAILSALRNFEGGAEVIDVFTLLDYHGFVNPMRDKNLANAFKTVNTQHVFRLMKCEKSEDFPLGVCTMYRAYSNDEVVEIVEYPDSDIGFAARKVKVEWQPKAAEGKPAGMYFLQGLPTSYDNLLPQLFIAGSAETTRATVASIVRKLTSVRSHPAAKHSWEAFMRDAPKTDDVNEYLRENPGRLHRPFENELRALCSGMPLSPRPIVDSTQSKRVGSSANNMLLPTVMSTGSVKWKKNMNPPPPRVEIGTGKDATCELPDTAAEVDHKQRAKRARSSKVLANYNAGTIVWIKADSWKDNQVLETKGKWPYPESINKYVVKGICKELDGDEGVVMIEFPVYGVSMGANPAYLKKHAQSIGNEVPKDVSEITDELYAQYEAKKKVVDWVPAVGDNIYVCCTAWKSTSYKINFPYSGNIEESCFRAKVIATAGSGKVRLEYEAFSFAAEEVKSVLWVKKWATESLPGNSTVISKEDYDLYE